jgi:oxygen-independent coproporphyrinogen-3 oxidase
MIKKEISLYVHIPFCVSKCKYCDFLSAPATESEKEMYVTALCRQVEREAFCYQDYEVKTIFFGGGTPTALAALQLGKILKTIQKNFSVSGGNVEISIECNPGTAGYEAFRKMIQAGFNRLSIGLQSANNEELKQLGRIHTWETFQKSYEEARRAGFQNINIDLMAALPGQSISSYRDTLRKTLAIKPEHISAYSLMIEEGTPFYNIYHDGNKTDGYQEYPPLPDEEEERGMYELTGWLLSEAGYDRYEISNYAQKGKECLHNCVYWQRGNYLGLGLGSSSMIENKRWKNTDSMQEFLQMDFQKKELNILSTQEQMEEFMFLGLRLMQGISSENFEDYFGCSFQKIYGNIVKKLIGQRFLEEGDSRIRLTKSGIDVSNRVLAEFLL